jgi:hypothetical protein
VCPAVLLVFEEPLAGPVPAGLQEKPKAAPPPEQPRLAPATHKVRFLSDPNDLPATFCRTSMGFSITYPRVASRMRVWSIQICNRRRYERLSFADLSSMQQNSLPDRRSKLRREKITDLPPLALRTPSYPSALDCGNPEPPLPAGQARRLHRAGPRPLSR